MKTRVTGFGTNLNIAPVLLHNSLDGVQAKTSALSNSFGGEKRFKDVRLDLRRDPGAVIADLNDYAGILAVSSDSKLALSPHCVNGIVNDVGPYLIELAPERIHEERNPLVVALHSHPRRSCS